MVMVTACFAHYAITGCESQHREVRCQIVQHLTTETCWRLLEHYTAQDDTIEEYIQRSRMGTDGVWGTSVELLAFSHLTVVGASLSILEVDHLLSW